MIPFALFSAALLDNSFSGYTEKLPDAVFGRNQIVYIVHMHHKFARKD